VSHLTIIKNIDHEDDDDDDDQDININEKANDSHNGYNNKTTRNLWTTMPRLTRQ
jgi:hypothetical protein